MKTDIITKT